MADGPETLRAELVQVLMDARHRIGQLKQKNTEEGGESLSRARRQVQDAKVALGERGRPWWEEPDEDAQRLRATAAVRTLLHNRKPDSSICPSDAARTIGSGADWRALMPLVRDVAVTLANAGQLTITQGEDVVDPAADLPGGPLRLRRGDRFGAS